MSKNYQKIYKMILVSILSALGALLMLLEIPYGPIPFLTFDLSDIVVLFIIVVFGFKAAFLSAGLKSFVHFLIKGPVGPAGIGQITAFLASIIFASLYFILQKLLFKNKELSKVDYWFRKVLQVILIALGFSISMAVLNYLFITPIWFGELTYLDVQSWVTPETFGLNNVVPDGVHPYLFTIIVIYIPFNLLKMICLSPFTVISEKLVAIFKKIVNHSN